MTGRQWWDKRPTEPVERYRHFQTYLDFGPGRSIDSAFVAYWTAAKGVEFVGERRAPGSWFSWSERWEWTARAEAYDRAIGGQGVLFRTLEEESADFRRRLRGGAVGLLCPCCARPAQIRKRYLTSKIARWVAGLYEAASGSTETFQHCRRIAEVCGLSAYDGDYAKARYFVLVELGTDSKNPEAAGAGEYRLTEFGLQWLAGEFGASKWVGVYDSTVYARSEELVRADDLLPDFDVEKIFESTPASGPVPDSSPHLRRENRKRKCSGGISITFEEEED